ncbi:MAG: hypothetical protein ISR78_02890 [Spirochaetia bacterium]|nr:hypothetical protein [Spirochaetia bacterium]
MDTIDSEDPLMDEYLDDDFEETRPVYDEDFMEEDLLEDEFVESISDEYDEDSLNDEGFYIEGIDHDEDSFSSTNGFDLDDYDD